MLRRIFAFLMILSLAFSFSSLSGSPAVSEAAVMMDSDYGLCPSDDIVIPIISEEESGKYDIPDNEAIRFAENLKIGWNLGNTFDAMDNDPGAEDRDYETYWCGAKTSKELIHALKEAGFNLIRMPVSWHNHLTDDQYTVDTAWLERIREVVKWITDEGMFVIINIHHDNSELFLYPDSKHYEQSEKYLTSIWIQVSELLADFDDHVIFESMNEPRLVNTKYEWWLDSRSSECKDAADCINHLNQKFVDTVRSSGGYNSSRYLLVPGYCASPDGAVSSLFSLPVDTVENRIMVEVHAYTPYNYALNQADPDSSFDLEKDRDKKKQIQDFMDSLYKKFIKQGIPVVIDEFGALQKNDDDLQGRVNFAAFYAASAAVRGIPCVWWDNHCFLDGERFGLIDRNEIVWVYPDIAIALLENWKSNR